MKSLLFILTSLFVINCSHKADKKNSSVIGMTFQNFKQINKLANYTKISDTVIYENNLEPKHGILHLNNQKNDLIIFKSISRDSAQNKIYKILDTLIIQNLSEPESITIGYCQTNEDNEENIIAIVSKTDGLKIKNIKKVWRANTVSNKIEIVNNLYRINCINEWFQEQ